MGRVIEFLRAKDTDECGLCRRPFSEHFQPPFDADPDLAANWCPSGNGFCSRSFRPSAPPERGE